jgi:Flp pilus assembly protein TadB
MKRHYTKGYYVSTSHKPADVKTVRSKPSGIPKTMEEGPEQEAIALEHVKNAKAEPNEITVKEIKAATPQTKDPVLVSKQDHASNLTASLKKKETYFSNPKKLITDVKKQDDVARDALSLLWILIVALLIIYIVGLILDSFGIGPVIHILGVVVLVLLILWLLRII